MCDNFCKDCRFRGGGKFKDPAYWSCDYIGYMNRPRGCASGAGCTKREIGKPGEKHPESWIGITYATKKKRNSRREGKQEKKAAPKRKRKNPEPKPELAGIAADIRAFRQEQGLTQKAFAETLGITSTTLYFWETARREPNTNLLRSEGMVIPKDADGI